MKVPFPATEILLRVNLATGLSEREVAGIAALSRENGGMEGALVAVIRRGLSTVRGHLSAGVAAGPAVALAGAALEVRTAETEGEKP